MIFKVGTREFDDYHDALEYEQELEEKSNEKEKRFKELCDAGNEYIRLRNEYERDYGTIGKENVNKDMNRVLKIKEYTDIVDNMLKFFY